MPNGLKKWFMLQVWRIQQVGQIVTIAMLSATLAGVVFNQIQWRLEGTPLYNSWVMVPLLIASIGIVIWAFSIWWDLRMRMWREQATVLMERNPYVKEKMTAKEILIYGALWLPLMEKIGSADPKMREATEALKEWLSRSIKSDEILAKDVEEILHHVGKPGSSLLDFTKK